MRTALIILVAWLVAPAASLAEQPVSGKLLVAARTTGGVFKHSIVYLIEHGEDGTLGVIVNRPTPALLKDMVPRYAELDHQNHAINYGGPVGLGALKFIVRGESIDENAVAVDDGIYASGSPELLETLLRRNLPPEQLLIFVGYAGWAPGQLDGELQRDVWHVLRMSAEFVFSTSDSSWQELIDRLEPRGLQATRPGELRSPREQLPCAVIKASMKRFTACRSNAPMLLATGSPPGEYTR